MQMPDTDSAGGRAQREKEALRQTWEVIAWVSALFAAAVSAFLFWWYPGWGEETGTIVLLALIGVTAFACWKLRETLEESVASSVSMRLALFGVIFLVLLLIGPFVFMIVEGIVVSITNWYVKAFS